jgi:hypothetical protein
MNEVRVIPHNAINDVIRLKWVYDNCPSLRLYFTFDGCIPQRIDVVTYPCAGTAVRVAVFEFDVDSHSFHILNELDVRGQGVLNAVAIQLFHGRPPSDGGEVLRGVNLINSATYQFRVRIFNKSHFSTVYCISLNSFVMMLDVSATSASSLCIPGSRAACMETFILPSGRRSIIYIRLIGIGERRWRTVVNIVMYGDQKRNSKNRANCVVSITYKIILTLEM